MINGSWDAFALVFILYYWVETKGKTLEEVDELLDGVKHSDAPDLEDVYKGKSHGEGLVDEKNLESYIASECSK